MTLGSKAISLCLYREAHVQLLTVATNQILQQEVAQFRTWVEDLQEQIQNLHLETQRQNRFLHDINSELDGQIRILTEQSQSLLEACQRAHEVNIAAVEDKFDLKIQIANLNLQLTNEQHNVRILHKRLEDQK